jgi:hypothetical protein
MIKVSVYPKNDGMPFAITFNDNEIDDVKNYTNHLTENGHEFIVIGLPKLHKPTLD